MTRFLLGVLVFALSISGADAQLKPTSLTGSWRMTEIKRSGQKPTLISNPQGLLIFTGKYYSRMFVDSDQPRATLRNDGTATAADFLAVWGPFTAASGTYEISGTTLTFRPLMAKNPQVMAPNATATSTFRLEGDKLIVTDVKNTGGPATSPLTITYTRVE